MSELSKLHSAVEAGDLETVRRLIKGGLKPDLKSVFLAIDQRQHSVLELLTKVGEELDKINFWGFTPLVKALKLEDDTSVRILLAAGALPDHPSLFGPPLFYAASRGWIDGVTLLVEAGADIEQRNSSDMTPLMVAAHMGHLKVVDALLRAGANPLSVDVAGRTAYEIALEGKEGAVVQSLLPVSKRVKPPREPLEQLLDAIRKYDVAEFNRCLASGADINARDKFGMSPLDCAIEAGSVEFVQKVLEAGAEVNVEDEGVSPLEAALRKNWPEIGEVLLKAGAIPKALGRHCAGPFQTICSMGWLKLARLALDAGADPNSADLSGETALMCAVRCRGSSDLVRLLISRGADPGCADANGWTVLFHAVQSNPAATFTHKQFTSGAKLIAAEPLGKALEEDRLIEIVSLLLDNGADINRRDNKGRTPLTFASTPGMARLLIHAGARLDIRDKQGHDVNYWLKKNGIAATLDSASKRSAMSKVQTKSKSGKSSTKRRRM